MTIQHFVLDKAIHIDADKRDQHLPMVAVVDRIGGELYYNAADQYYIIVLLRTPENETVAHHQLIAAMGHDYRGQYFSAGRVMDTVRDLILIFIGVPSNDVATAHS